MDEKLALKAAFERERLFPYTIVGYYVLVNGKVFTGVSGRRIWQSASSAKRMLRWTLAKHGLEEKDFQIKYMPIRNYYHSEV